MKAFRNGLKLTQYELAMLLDVSRSVITLYEKGLRNLPPKATLKLHRLKQLWEESEKEKAAPSGRLFNHCFSRQQKMAVMLKADAQRAAAAALRISQRLHYMEQRHQSLLLKLQFIQALAQETHPATRQMRFLQTMEQQTILAMENCCPAYQQWAVYKLELLNAWQQLARRRGVAFCKKS